MREALAGLTLRGRTLLTAGLTCVVCGIVLGQRGLVEIGAFLVALVVLTVVAVGRGRYDLALTRTISARVVRAGQPAQVRLVIANLGRVPTGSLLLEEELPYALGNRPRFTLTRIGRGWRRELEYQVRSELRGLYDIGPMTVRVCDPFGLITLDHAFEGAIPLTVTPRTVALPGGTLGGLLDSSGDSRPRAFAVGSAEDVTVREYRHGDDLRRVHWHSSARTGELMVRREEQPWQARATLVVDNRERAHRGRGSASSFEAVVAAAASVAVHLSERGFTVRLATTSGESDATWHPPTTRATSLLETLAVLEPTDHPLIDTSWIGEGGAALTVAVLGALDEADDGALHRIRQHASAALAVAVDVAQWSDDAREAAALGAASSLSHLVRNGWRASLMGQAGIVPAWQGLASQTSGRVATRAGVTQR